VQQPADMIAMILDPKLAADQFGNAGCSPQIGAPAMRRGSLEQQPHQHADAPLSPASRDGPEKNAP